MSSWRHMDEAPKDEPIIVDCGSFVDVAQWDDWWEREGPGWYSEIHHDGSFSVKLEPLGWQPLPIPSGRK